MVEKIEDPTFYSAYIITGIANVGDLEKCCTYNVCSPSSYKQLQIISF